MAFMIPSTLRYQADTTRGELLTFDLLSSSLPDSCVVRYEVILGERHYRPDFTLVDPERGVLIVEVKDWEIERIVKASPEQFWVKFGYNTPSIIQNPRLKCEIYLRRAREQMVAMSNLRQENGDLSIPINYLIVLTNISKQEFTDKELHEVIPLDHLLFREELNTQSFHKKYEQLLRPLPNSLSSEQLDSITKSLFPDIVIRPENVQDGFIRSSSGVVVEEIEPFQFSLEQEQIAKSLGEGPRLLRGIAGTGKTLIMLYRAKLLAANNPKIRILILCWNISLATYMKQAYQRIQIDAKGDVTILHFSEFARILFSDYKVSPVNIDDPNFDRNLNLIIPHEQDQYDAIYVDEAQDFKKEWISFLYKRFLKPGNNNLLIAADDAQRIYNERDFDWKSLDIPFEQSNILKTVYRNSARVWVFSAFLLKEKASYIRENPERVRFSTKGGYDPLLIECKDIYAQIEKAIEIIKSSLKEGYAAKNTLILYRHKKVGKKDIVGQLKKRLKQEGIPFDWISEDKLAKRSFDWEADTVKISTVHSAKGMDSPVVIILGAETFSDELSEGEYDELKVMYVALTRAREFLVVLYSGNGGLVPQLLNCQSEYLKYRDSIIELEKTS